MCNVMCARMFLGRNIGMMRELASMLRAMPFDPDGGGGRNEEIRRFFTDHPLTFFWGGPPLHIFGFHSAPFRISNVIALRRFHLEW